MNADPFTVADLSIPVTISLGVAEAWDDDDAESLVARADRALYKAKAAGRDCVQAAIAKGLSMDLVVES
jgi:PleD family two-component response regulator